MNDHDITKHLSLNKNKKIRNFEKSNLQEKVNYTTEEKNEIQVNLNKVLGPEYVSSRSNGNGPKVSYIEGWRILNLANEVFGFNGWNSELITTEVDFFDINKTNNRILMGLSVVVRVSLKDGTFHEDFGYGYIDNAKSKAMAFEKCKKEAFTDGIKRCLRCFGNVLGNCLYDRTIMSRIREVNLPEMSKRKLNFYRDSSIILQQNQNKDLIHESVYEDSSTRNNFQTENTEKTNNNTKVENKNKSLEKINNLNSANIKNKSNNFSETSSTNTNNHNKSLNNIKSFSDSKQKNTDTKKVDNKQEADLITKINLDNEINVYNTKIVDKIKPLEDNDDMYNFSDELKEEDFIDNNNFHNIDFTNVDDNKACHDHNYTSDFSTSDGLMNSSIDLNSFLSKGTTIKNYSSKNSNTINENTNTSSTVKSPIFISAKTLNDIKDSSDLTKTIIPYDLNFVPKSYRRTINTNKSIPIKRTQILNEKLNSKLSFKLNNISKPSLNPTLSSIIKNEKKMKLNYDGNLENSDNKKFIGLPLTQNQLLNN